MNYEFPLDEFDHRLVLSDNVKVKCTHCKRILPISKVGLRRMGDGTIRVQPQCMACRK